MAKQSLLDDHKEWKLGTKCDFFNRNTRKWVEAEVIGSYSDDQGHWVKVRCGQKDHNVLSDDPDLRKRALISGDQLKQLQNIAAQVPSITPILESILPSSSEQGLYSHSDERMTWFKVVNCVNTELFPVLAIALRECIDAKLSEDVDFKLDNFEDDVMDDIMERLKGKRAMNNKEVQYLKGLFGRAIETTQKRLVQNITQTEPTAVTNEMEKCKDISPEWPGLTVSILHDIFGVHKALVFGRLQRADYPLNEFMNNLQSAEKKVFGGDICSQHVQEQDQRFNLSFYPEYLLNDNLFEVMACHYAVSSMVRTMRDKMNGVNELHILSVVIPAGISSRYDVDVQYQPTITNMDQLTSLNPSQCGVHRTFESNLENVPKLAKQMEDMISRVSDDGVIPKNIVVVFNRHQTTVESANTVCILGFEDTQKLKPLYQNNFLCFEFNIARNEVISIDDMDTVVCCWMNFGVAQRLRFYPEYAVWIIPYLFVRSTKMTAHKFLELIYDDNYKHGWRVSLDDPIFNKYYHIITRHQHISNNYNRNEVDLKQDGVQRLLRDFLERKLKWETARKLRKYTKEYAFDSEAILEDMEDVNDSNIVSLGDLDGGESRTVKFAVLKFQNMECSANSVRDLADCEHIHILIENLQKFEDCGLVVDALNVVQFDVDSAITSFDHIIKVHGFLSDAETKLKIQNFVAEHITCLNGEECAVLRAHSQRTREREKVEEKRDEPVHEVDTLCEVTADTLNSIHSYILHQDTHLYRLLSGREKDGATRFSTGVDDEEQSGIDEEAKVEDVGNAMQSQGINFGINILQWLQFEEQPQFESVGEEMVQNPDSTIDAAIFQQFLMICLAKIKGTNYTVNEMVCLKMYTDTNEMQSQLRKAHWTAALLKVRKAYYQWAMGLYRAHLYHDEPIPTAPDAPSKPCRLFHGLNRLFTVSHEMPVYNGPFSTTIAKTVASTFCDERGLIWLIQPSYANPLKVVVGINVDWISGFKHEREVLLYNQCLPIEKTETFDDDSNILMNHFIRSLVSRESPIIKKEAFYKQLGIRYDAKWMQLICDHQLLFEKTEYNGMRVVDRLVMELGAVEPNLTVKLWNTKHGDKSELEHLALDLKATQLSVHCRVLTTKFKLLHFSPFLNRTWLRIEGNTDDFYFKETEYKTNGECFAPTTNSVKSQVTKIQVKNSKLFGNRFVNLQTFDEEQDHKDLSDDFIDALSVDKYGFVFVDNIPKMNHQFVIGDMVQHEDGLGKICEFKTDEICIEIGDERRWIERRAVPMETTLAFPHQQDIGKYVFMIHSSANGGVPNESEANLLSFSDINQFEIPYGLTRNLKSDMVSFAIYAKPKGSQLPLILIKSIEYVPVNDGAPLIQLTGGSKLDVNSMVNYLMKILQERDSEIKDEAAFLNSVGLNLNDQSEWIEYITEHPMLFEVTLYRRKLVIERLIVELNLLNIEWIPRILEQKKDNKPLLDWLVEDRKILNLSDHYRVITSKFKIVHFSPLLNRSWLKLEKSNKMENLGVAVDDDRFEGNEYKVNGQIFASTTLSVEGQVSRVEVKNTKLFGSSFVTLQTFEDVKDNQDEENKAFIDSLSVDKYGFIFVDDTPKTDHQFVIGDNVKCNDGSRGKVCEETADQICIEIGKERRWIPRRIIPMTITLIFQHQQDIAKYAFVISAGSQENDQNPIAGKEYSFSDITRFKIPYPTMIAQPSDVISVDIYTKPKGMDVPLIKVKSLQYPPSDVDEPMILNTESAVNHFIGTLKQTRTEIRDEAAFLNLFGLDPDDHSKWMHLIFDHPLLFDVTSYRKKSIIERLIVELNLLNFEWIHKMLEQKKQNKALIEWLVEDREMFKLLQHYRIMTSKFKIEKSSKLLGCSWVKFERNVKADDTFEIKKHDTQCYDKTEYRINETVVPLDSRSVDGAVDIITVKNSELFGDGQLTLQRIGQLKESEFEAKPQESIRDLLCIDETGAVTVQIGVAREVQMKRNNNWVRGVVTRLTEDKICVKIHNEDICSFHWIYSADIWTSIKVSEHENEISEFQFAARAGNEGDAGSLSDLKPFTFANVRDFRIEKDLLSASSKAVNAVHIYAKPKIKNLKYHHLKTLKKHFDAWSFTRYCIDKKESFVIDTVVKLKPFSESLGSGGRFEVLSSSEITISEYGGVDASECGLKMSSNKYQSPLMLKFGRYIGDHNVEPDAEKGSHIVGSGGGTICLIAVGAVVNRGTLVCRGTDGGMFSGGTVCILSDDMIKNEGNIDGGHDGEMTIQCDRFVNEGRIVPVPELFIGTAKSLRECLRNKTTQMNGRLLMDSMRCFDVNRGSRVLEFSTEFKSANLKLEEQNMWVMSSNTSNDYRYVLTAEDPVFQGIHCWRIQMKLRDPSKQTTSRLILWAVSDKQKFSDYSYSKIWGIGYNDCWYGRNGQQNNRYKVNTHDIFRFADGMEVDMLFDVDQRILKFCRVGKCEPDKEYDSLTVLVLRVIFKIYSIKHPNNDKCGWVPHLNIYSAALKVRIASIPVEMYGETYDDLWY